MINNIYPDKYDPTYFNQKITEDDYALAFRKDGILIKYENDNIVLPKYIDIFDREGRNKNFDKESAWYLFAINSQSYFLLNEINEEYPYFSSFDEVKTSVSDAGMFYLKMQEFREYACNTIAFAGVNAYHLRNWKRTKNYCGVCGNALEPSAVERAFVCSKCGQIEYPKISPAIIVAITDGDKLLLVHNKLGNYKKLALVAGYVEIGETFDEAVIREVKEEVGLNVKNLQYIDNQPWGLTGAQMIAYKAEVDGSREIILEERELSSAKWYKRCDIPEITRRTSIGNEMIYRFKHEML